MRTIRETTDRPLRDEPQYVLCRGLGGWEVTFAGRRAAFRHEEGVPYVAWLLLHPPRKPIHALALALEARTLCGQTAGAAEISRQRYLELDEAETVRSLRRREHELEAVLDDYDEIEPVKAAALRELEAIADFMRAHPWRGRACAQRCVWAVSGAINRLYAHLAGAVDAEGQPDAVLQAFARHLHEHLLLNSDGGGIPGAFRLGAALPGWFTYEPPAGVVWGSESQVRSLKAKVQSPRSKVQSLESKVQGSKFNVQGSKFSLSPSEPWRPAAVDYLSRFVCAGLALALLATGCAGPRPLRGGKAVTTRKPAGAIEQTLIQGENPSQATKQDQESVKVRTYTVPAGSRMEQSQIREGERPREPKTPSRSAQTRVREDALPPGSQQPATAFVLSAPMPVVEREETRARTELGAAQKDTARDLGARLASLKGVVWVGIGLAVFGLASLVWPPLKVIIGSVTTSAALMLGGVALMVLPSLIVGNELLILGGVAVGTGGWFLAHRHGQLRGMVAARAGSQSSVTSNQ